jgi:hypothetical protein
MINKKLKENFVEIVIDNVRKIYEGKVCIGDFRKYKKG